MPICFLLYSQVKCTTSAKQLLKRWRGLVLVRRHRRDGQQYLEDGFSSMFEGQMVLKTNGRGALVVENK